LKGVFLFVHYILRIVTEKKPPAIIILLGWDRSGKRIIIAGGFSKVIPTISFAIGGVSGVKW